MKKENILVSACLLGINCRYDGGNGLQEDLIGLMEKYNLIPVCPEQLGGLETPREPAEQLNRDDTGNLPGIRVVNRSGKDVTDSFVKGAEETWDYLRWDVFGDKSSWERCDSKAFGGKWNQGIRRIRHRVLLKQRKD